MMVVAATPPHSTRQNPAFIFLNRQTDLCTAEAVDDPREGVSNIVECSALAVIARSCMPMLNLPAIPRRTAIGHLDPVATATAPPLATIVPLRAAAPPTLVNTTSHVLLVDVTMLVHYHNVLVQLVLLSPQRSNISSAVAPACQMLAEIR